MMIQRPTSHYGQAVSKASYMVYQAANILGTQRLNVSRNQLPGIEKLLLGSHAYHPYIMPLLTLVKRAKESAPFQSNIIQHFISFHHFFWTAFHRHSPPCP